MKLKSTLTFLVVIAASILTVITYNALTKKKSAYVDVQKIFNEFTYKKQLEKEYKAIYETKKNYIDSLKLNLELLKKSEKAEDERVYEFEKYVAYAQDKFEEEQEGISMGLNEKVWTRLNGLIENYGKDNHYDFIYGAEGGGSIMYADPNNNISEEVIKYVNEKFDGQ